MSAGNKSNLKILKWRLYHAYLNFKVFFIRKKKKIRFLFILSELSQWKTERLYKAMLQHPRFEPLLGITTRTSCPGVEKTMEEYCRQKGYDYFILDPEKTINSQVKTDFVTHQQPYISEINPALYIDSNKNIPVVLIPYYIPFLMEDWTVNNRLAVLAWKNLVNHESCAEAWAKTHKLKGTNYAVTGLPVMDDLLVPKEEYEDVWPCKDGRRRIIYSPHHTIADIHWEGIAYSTFLDYCQFMLDLREKYRDKVYFVFKPHPSLKYRLYKIWGEEKTDEYYSRWDVPGVSHVEQGQYMALFKHSDALIHDCGSFTLEYMYTGNPVMYLVRDEHRTDNLTPCAKEAFDLHYKAYSEKDIENFVLNVIAGRDPLKERRELFKQDKLLSPNGKTACENIIDLILGTK